jgi:hypothetical protein
VVVVEVGVEVVVGAVVGVGVEVGVGVGVEVVVVVVVEVGVEVVVGAVVGVGVEVGVGVGVEVVVGVGVEVGVEVVVGAVVEVVVVVVVVVGVEVVLIGFLGAAHMGLADILSPRLVELGRIKIGRLGQMKTSAGGKQFRQPEKLDHFLITLMNRSQTGDLIVDEMLMKQLTDKHGDADGKIRRLPIYLLSNEIDDALQVRYVWYDKKTCIASSDGVTIDYHVDERGNPLDVPQQFPFDINEIERIDPKTNRPRFKLHASFSCVIASGSSRWGGVYRLRTTSKITADQLYGSMLHLQGLLCGQLAGVPLFLVIRPIQVAPDGKATTVYVAHVEVQGTDMLAIQKTAREQMELRLANATHIRQAEIQFKKLLALPGGEPPDEIEAIQAEFSPPDEAVDPVEAAKPAGAKLADRLVKAHKPTPAPPVTPPEPPQEPQDERQEAQDFFDGQASEPDPAPEAPKRQADSDRLRDEAAKPKEPEPSNAHPSSEVWDSPDKVPDDAVATFDAVKAKAKQMVIAEFGPEFADQFVSNIGVHWAIASNRPVSVKLRREFLHLLSVGKIEVQDAAGKASAKRVG